MRFRGFLAESKAFMNYANMPPRERAWFWFRMPFVWMVFTWLCWRDTRRV